MGPFRVLPGRLSVSRTFGDIEAKKQKYGGNPKVIVADPEIKAFKIEPSYDFILLACKESIDSCLSFIGDGVFDKLSNQDVLYTVWDVARKNFK